MFYLAQSLLTLGKVYSLSEIKREVMAVDVHRIRDFAQSIFRFENMSISYVGNIGEGAERRIRKILKNYGS